MRLLVMVAIGIILVILGAVFAMTCAPGRPWSER